MGVSRETRKPIDQLTRTDLLTFPVWGFALDEEGSEDQDETWVRPLNAQVVPTGHYSLHVAADFKAACGRTYGGFVTVTTAEEPVDIFGGVILHESGQESNYLPIPCPGMFGFRDLRDKLLAGLGLLESEIFPITFTLRVPIEGEQVLRSGELG